MFCKKYPILRVKQYIVKLLIDGNTMLKIATKLDRNYRTNQKVIENIGKLRTRINVCKNIRRN